MGHVLMAMNTQHRPPVIDMTPEGEFRDAAPPRPASTFDRLLARVGGIAMLVAFGAGALVLAGLAVLAIGILLPVALVAGLVGGGSLWWRMRRAARNDGWMHGGGDPEELDTLLAKLAKFREEAGTADRDDYQIHVISLDAYSLDGIKRLEDKGITDVIVGFRIPYIMGQDTEPLDDKIRNLEWFAENVIAKA